VLCVCYMRKVESKVCYVFVTWGRSKVMCYVYVTWERTKVMCVLCLLHEEKKVICVMFVTWGRTKVICAFYIRKDKRIQGRDEDYQFVTCSKKGWLVVNFIRFMWIYEMMGFFCIFGWLTKISWLFLNRSGPYFSRNIMKNWPPSRRNAAAWQNNSLAENLKPLTNY